MALVLELRVTRNGSTVSTLDLVDGDNYQLNQNGWSPTISKRRLSKLGGRSPYEDVQEEINITVKGTSKGNCLTNLNALVKATEAANQAWENDEENSYVRIQYAPDGTNVSSASGYMWSLLTGGDAEVIIPKDFHYYQAEGYYLSDVTLRFTRKGLWVTNGSQQISSTTDEICNVRDLTFTPFSPDIDSLAPMEFSFEHDNVDGTADYRGFFILMSYDDALPPNVLTSSGGTQVAVTSATRLSAGTRYVRRISSDTDLTFSPTGGGSGITNRYRVMAKVRKTIASDYFDLTAYINTAFTQVQSETIVLPETTDVQLVDFGHITSRNGLSNVVLSINTSSPSGYLYFDSLLIYEDTDTTNVLYLENFNSTSTTGLYGLTLDTDQQFPILSQYTPSFSAGIVNIAPYRGNIYFVHRNYADVRGVIYAAEVGGTNFNPANSSNVIADWDDLAVTIYPAYLSPI